MTSPPSSVASPPFPRASRWPWVLAGAGLAWLGGVGFQLQQAQLAAGRSVVAATLLALVMIVAACLGFVRAQRRLKTRPSWALWALVLAAGLLAFASTTWRAQMRLGDRLAPELEGKNLWLTGVVASLPSQGTQGVRFEFVPERAETAGGQDVTGQVPSRIALGWYKGFHADSAEQAPPKDLQAGQRWRWPVRLRLPHGAVNPGGFDAELWLFEQGLRATGYVRVTRAVLGTPQAPQRLADEAGYPLQRLRQRVRDAIYRQVADPAAAGVLAALVVGDQQAISQEGWATFRNTGVAHLMSISGLHITMLAWLSAAAIGWVWRRSWHGMRTLPAPTAARWGGVAVAVAYAMFAGWGVPAQRTVIMLATLAGLQTVGWRWPWPLTWLLAAVAVTALDPWALLQPGFWLSFVAVGLLMGSSPITSTQERRPDIRPATLTRLQRSWQAVKRAAQGGLRAQVLATLGLAPLSLVCFGQLSLVGFAANLLAIPLVTLLITPLGLLGVLLPGLWSMAAGLITGLTVVLSALAQWPWAVWSVPHSPAWAQCLGLLGAVIVLLPWPWRWRLSGVFWMLPLLWPRVDLPPPGQFELVALDVGQGTAIAVRTNAHTLVFDTGPPWGDGVDAGQRVLVPWLRYAGVQRLDMLMLSHRDNDHTGGAISVLRALPVLALRSSMEAAHPIHDEWLRTQAAGAVSTRCEAGQSWDWDGVHFELLHPSPDDYTAARKSNAMSCVLRIQAQAQHGAAGRVALLTGDLEAAQERALLAHLPPEHLRAQVLQVPHHGSKTSSSQGFVDAVRPQVAVVQAGYRSRFGHPKPEVVARYIAGHAQVTRSDRCGAWHWVSDQPPAQAGQCERALQRRYWHSKGSPVPAEADDEPVDTLR